MFLQNRDDDFYVAVYKLNSRNSDCGLMEYCWIFSWQLRYGLYFFPTFG
jgi:hypothetical protein